MAIHSLQHTTEPTTQHTIVIAGADHGQRTFLAEQLDADGHTIHEADDTAAVIAKLSSHAVDVLLLGELKRPYETTVRSVRDGRHPRVHPGLAVITLGPGDELSTHCAPTRAAATTTSQPPRATSCCAPSSQS